MSGSGYSAASDADSRCSIGYLKPSRCAWSASVLAVGTCASPHSSMVAPGGRGPWYAEKSVTTRVGPGHTIRVSAPK